MKVALPPLNALKAFEAAARHLSIKLAAEELCVTAGAVSQMIKVLEAHLGVRLFERVTRGIYLTDAGRRYLPPVRTAFRQIAEASERVVASVESGSLTISVTPFFASSWLIPRMKSFQDKHPEIDLQVMATSRAVDLFSSGVDIAVRHGLGRYPGLRSDRVVTVEMIAVAAPSLVSRLGLPRSHAELSRWPHVHDYERQGWRLWFEANDIDETGSQRGPSFSDTSLMLKAVLSGQGAGLLPAAMVAEEVERGQLIQLIGTKYLAEFAYYLVCPESKQDHPKIKAIRDWMTAFDSGVGTTRPKRKRST